MQPMPPKARRHHRIAALIGSRPLKNQEQLRRLLAGEGIEVTQATLSRDLKEMGVWKGPAGFSLPGEQAPGAGGPGADDDILARALEQEMLAADQAAEMVVLRTRPGHANALAVEIDRARPPEVVGTIAGDDTVFVAVRSSRDGQRLLGALREHLV